MRINPLMLSILVCACSNSDPFENNMIDAHADNQVGSDGGGSDTTPHECEAAPSRIVVLGDSIVACSVIGGAQSPDCVSKKLVNYVVANYGPGALYQNHAAAGAVLADIAGQLNAVTASPGPALVYIYIGGNNLSPFIFQSDAAATAAWMNTIQPMLDTVYNSVFTALANTTKFPDGATLLMNTQYNPFDDCTAAPYNLSATKTGLLHMFNDKLNAIAAAHPKDALIVDQFTPFLGHGQHYNVSTCPYYKAGMEAWMQDTIHANAVGNTDLADVANAGADRLYRDCVH